MLQDIVILQKREMEKRLGDGYVERSVKKIADGNDLVVVILGPRRAGKSFFGMHFIQSKKSFGYVNFDDERLVGISDFDELLSVVNIVYNNPEYLLLDEIQNVEKWELLVNRLQRQGKRLVVTGSNAHLLSSEFATHLTGRHIALTLFPFSFIEYTSVSIKTLPATQLEQKEHLSNYIRDGGYPEPLIKNIDRNDYLSTLLEATIYKNIVKRFKIRSIDGIEDLARYLLSTIGSEYSYRTLAEVTKCKSWHTVEKYLRHLEDSFLFFSLRRFSFKVKEQTKANKKIYCIDNGFVTASAFGMSEGIGRLAENAVAIRLRKHELDGKCEVYFWKNNRQHEVDFVVMKNRKIDQMIQVCWNLDKKETMDRELRALITAGEELNCNNLQILTDSRQGTENVEWFGKKKQVKIVPIWKWMIEEI